MQAIGKSCQENTFQDSIKGFQENWLDKYEADNIMSEENSERWNFTK